MLSARIDCLRCGWANSISEKRFRNPSGIPCASASSMNPSQSPRAPGHVSRFYSERRCAYCDTALDVHQLARGGICGHPACRRKQVVDLVTQRAREKAAEIRRAAEEFRARFASRMADPTSLTLAIVPDFHRSVVKVTQARRMKFRAHIVRVVRQAFEEAIDASAISELAEELSKFAE